MLFSSLECQAHEVRSFAVFPAVSLASRTKSAHSRVLEKYLLVGRIC